MPNVVNRPRNITGQFTQEDPEERFLRKVNKTSTCWLWTGILNSSGYGKFVVYGQEVSAHRFSFSWYRGTIPAGLYVLHHCDIRNCVNPSHLFVGSAKDNMKDMVSKGRGYSHHKNQTHCKRGHEFNKANTTVRLNGKRECRRCNNARNMRNRSQNASGDPKRKANT